MVDGWMGDDWFHNGAFRQDGALQYVYDQEATRKNDATWWTDARDTYEVFLRAGSAGALAKARGVDELGYWRELVAHTAYDSFWQNQAVDKVLAKDPPKVPMLIVSGLFDQEDMYGGPALYQALAGSDPRGERVHLVLGPWNHGQGRREGRGIGPIMFEGDTAAWFRRTIMQPYLDYYLKDGPKPDTLGCSCTRREPTSGIATMDGLAHAPPGVLQRPVLSICWPTASSDSSRRRRRKRSRPRRRISTTNTYPIREARPISHATDAGHWGG